MVSGSCTTVLAVTPMVFLIRADSCVSAASASARVVPERRAADGLLPLLLMVPCQLRVAQVVRPSPRPVR